MRCWDDNGGDGDDPELQGRRQRERDWNGMAMLGGERLQFNLLNHRHVHRHHITNIYGIYTNTYRHVHMQHIDSPQNIWAS